MSIASPARARTAPLPRSSRARAADPLERFFAELDALRDELEAQRGADDVAHMRKQSRRGRWCSAAGYACAWIAPNPLAIALISLGRFTRWVTVAHTTLHGAYDRAPGAGTRETSRGFARGLRRWLDWNDVIEPAAWREEHNLGHHCYLGDERDPDRMSSNMAFARRLPRPARVPLLAALALTWKWTYYAPKVLSHERAGERRPGARRSRRSHRARLLLGSFAPYAAVHFVALPAAFSVLGPWAVGSVLFNSLAAELLTNLHSFLVIAPNHTGPDLPVFSQPAGDRREYVLRQIVGSVDYTCGTELSDFLTGYIGYQIEHHLWPSMTLRQYRAAQPRVEQLCRAHGIPYRREPLHGRIAKMLRVVLDDALPSVVRSARELLPEATTTRERHLR